MRAHGTRARYTWGPGPGKDAARGCRCTPCVEANRAYARKQQKRKRLEPLGRTSGPFAPPFVDAAPARAHLLVLADAGIGYRRAAELADVARSSVAAVRTGKATRIRRETAAAILAVPVDADVADSVLVDAAPTWKLIDAILRRAGWTKARIGAELGQNGRALQLGTDQITARHARTIRALAQRLEIIDPLPKRRFPLAPLLGTRTIKDLERLTGVADRQLHRWKDYGIPMDRADELACMLGHHPSLLWDDWYDESEAA